VGLDRYFGLSEKVVILTGATKGIGLAMAHAFADAGAKLVLASNEDEACHALAGELPQAIAVPTDVTQRAQLAALADAAEAHFGGIDVLLCNAGIPGPFGPTANVSDDEREALFKINLEHPLHLSNLIAPRLAARGGGSIVLTASIGGMRGNRGVGTYGLTKAALIQLARNLAVEWGPQGVRANAVAPGVIATSWAKNILSDPEATARRLQMTPLRRIGEPWEVAAAALFLAGPGAGFITGQVLAIDGGTLITDGS